MRIAVLGGNGFIGSALCRELLRKGYEVSSFDRVAPLTPLDGINYISGDFFSQEDLFRVVDACDVIFHAISTVNPGNSNELVDECYARDLVQSVRLFEHCAKENKRVIFLSSGGTVYGPAEITPTPETAPLRPINHYGAVKSCIESAMRAFVFQNQADMLIARIANPYGPGQDYRKGVGFIDAATRRALAGETIEIWGDGSAVRDYVHINDVVLALTELVKYRGKYHVFNIGTGVGTSQKRVIELLEQFGLCFGVRYLPKRSVDIPLSVLDCSRISGIIDVAFTPFEAGLHTYIEFLAKYL